MSSEDDKPFAAPNKRARSTNLGAVDKAVSMIVLGGIAPIALMLLGWWGTLWLLGDTRWIPWMAGTGFFAGLALDATLALQRSFLQVFCWCYAV